MTRKADFNAEEWATVAEAPVLAGMRLVAASRGGTIRESIAVGEAYTKARQAHGESELLDALVAAPPAADPGQLRSSGDIAKLSNDRILGALQILEQKASPEEVEAYKMFVTAVAHAAANAHREGGFLGVGGTHVSDEEQQALDELAANSPRPSAMGAASRIGSDGGILPLTRCGRRANRHAA